MDNNLELHINRTDKILDIFDRNTEKKLSLKPGIWETEPKTDHDLDIYYEIGQSYPTVLDKENVQEYIRVGRNVFYDDGSPALYDPVFLNNSVVNIWGGSGQKRSMFSESLTTIISLQHDLEASPGDILTFKLIDGSCVTAEFVDYFYESEWVHWSNSTLSGTPPTI